MSEPAPRTLTRVGENVDWPDSVASTQVRDRLADRPELGHLAELAEWAAGVLPDRAPDRVCALVVTDGDPSPAAAAAADSMGASLRCIRPGPEVAAAVDAGARLADEQADLGTDLLVLASPGVAEDAAVATSVLTSIEPVKVLARGAAATDAVAWMNLAVRVRDARRACLACRDEPDELVAAIGSPRLGLLAGALVAAATRKLPVLIDGPVVAAASLVAYEAQPRAVRWWAAADLSAEPMHELALTRLGQRAVLGLGTGLGDGLAGLLVVPVLRAALVACAG